MSNELKVSFTDTSSSQYDDSADRIKVKGLDTKDIKMGKLYLGDRHSASYLQLKHRNCSSVVNCCTDCHGLAREIKVGYHKVDPDEDDYEELFNSSFDFIDTELIKGKHVLCHCEDGIIKSGAIVVYYIMKKKSVSLAEAYRIVQKYRVGLKIKASLIKKLAKMEKRIRGSVSLMYDMNKKQIVFLDKDNSGLGHKAESGGSCCGGPPKKISYNTGLYVGVGVGAFFAIVFGVIFMLTGKI